MLRHTPQTICFVGASLLFVPKVVKDLAQQPAFHGSRLVLHDLVQEPIDLLCAVCQRISDTLHADFDIVGTTDQTVALAGADHVLICISVGGRAAAREDIAICQRYGCDHVIGDTIGPAALARNLRTWPVVMQLAQAISDHCPNAVVINFSNPMSVITATLSRHTPNRVFGLCHGTGELLRALAHAYAVPVSQVQISVAGVNHFAFVTHVSISGIQRQMSDVFDLLEEASARGNFNQRDPAWGSALGYHYTIELGRRLGMMTNNPDRHTAEFLPSLLRPQRKVFTAETADYDDRIRRLGVLRDKLQTIADTGDIPDVHKPSGEEAEGLMLSFDSSNARRIVLNVPNHGAVAGLADDALLEVYKLVSQNGVTNDPIIVLPSLMRNIIERLVLIHELTMEAARTASRDLAMQALMLEANDADFDRIPAMLDDLLAHNATLMQVLLPR